MLECLAGASDHVRLGTAQDAWGTVPATHRAQQAIGRKLWVPVCAYHAAHWNDEKREGYGPSPVEPLVVQP